MPQVSIIMPICNSEKYLEETIKNIINQTFKDWELIIVDDCSNDDSLDIINKLDNGKIIIIKNEKNIGAGLSRNRAINISKGRYIAFIDSDDIWKENKLEEQISFMKEKDVAFSFSSYKGINEYGEPIREVNAPKQVSFKDMLKSTPIQISTVVLDTKKIKKELIKFENMRTCEDIDFYLKLLKNVNYASGIQEFLVDYKIRKKSLSSNKIMNTIRRWNVYKKHNVSFIDRCINIGQHVKNSISRNLPTKRIKEILAIIKVKYIIDVIIFPFIWILSLLAKPLCNGIWIIAENPSEACDNGYIFFKYLRENRKDINAYYVIEKKSKNYQRVKKFGNILNYRSLKHWIYYLNAKRIIVTQKYSNPSMMLLYILHKKNIIKTPRIFLQHGIIINDCPVFYYNRTNFRLFICGAKREYEYVMNNFGYPKENVVYTGLARFDNLDLRKNTKNRLILVVPTWRIFITKQAEFDEFFNKYYNLISDNKLIRTLEENDIKLQLVLHKNMNKFKINKSEISKNIIINHNEEVNIQDLLNKTELMITDYSSIFMDIGYRKRPIIYYQFDKEKFREKHLEEGYFSYENDGFGDVLTKQNEVIKKIEYYINNNFEIEEKYSKKMDDFFERKDKNNCKRILEEIEKI